MGTKPQVPIRTVLALAVVVVLVGGALALARTSALTIKLNPTSGKSPTVSTMTVKGYSSQADNQLALSMVIQASKPCPASYTKGFSTLTGVGTAGGKPMGPRRLKKGPVNLTIKVQLGSSDPGTYSVCAYIQRGAVTKAHASAKITFTG
jgi:hypothetical protein